MRRFLTAFLKFCTPLFVLLAAYPAFDVFRVVRRYDVFYDAESRVGLNRAYVSTCNYANRRDTIHYDSFIFGNSRSLYYETAAWSRHLPAGSRCYHFDASAESLKGMLRKISFVDEQGDTLRNVLLILDHELLSADTANTGHLFATPPMLTDGWGALQFHAAHLRAFLTPTFLLAAADFALFKTYRPYMGSYIEQDRFGYDALTNEMTETDKERRIAEGNYYVPQVMRSFENCPQADTTSTLRLTPRQQQMLSAMAGIFRRHGTDCRVVLGPQYDQVRINEATLRFLKATFGSDKVFNFSGPNRWNADYHNYYESSHYRPHVAAEVMDIVYGDDE